MSNLEVPSSDLDMPTPEQLWQYCDLLRIISRQNGRVRRARSEDIIPVVPGTVKLGVAPKAMLTPDERLLLSGEAEYMLPGELDEWSNVDGRLELERYRRYVASLKSMGEQARKLSVIESDYTLRAGVAYEGARSMFTFLWDESGTSAATLYLYSSMSAVIEGVSFVWRENKDHKVVKTMIIDDNEPMPNPPDPDVTVPQLATTSAGDTVTVSSITKESLHLLKQRTMSFGTALMTKAYLDTLERN